ncbi:MAG: shikimate dehydrogenase [Alcaligenaceae bacterium]|nr:shikimate dehydrogenase [Alcaligenaceae bacterium]
MTAGFGARGMDAVVVPIHVTSRDLPAFLESAKALQNVDGVIATVPHKFDAYGFCSAASDRARFLGAANVLRRSDDGGWYGDMVDGTGFVAALHEAGGQTQGRRALLVGAGGAGSAIAHALVESGVASLAVCDADAARRDALVSRLAGLNQARIEAGTDDPAGFDLVVNATPMGMKEGDPSPVRVDNLAVNAFVGDAITVPEVSPLIAAARANGCGTVTGLQMFASVSARMLDFYSEPNP